MKCEGKTQPSKVLDEQELDFIMALKGKLNQKEYAFLMRRATYSQESLAKSARKLGIKEDHARQITLRLRKKIDHILGINAKINRPQKD